MLKLTILILSCLFLSACAHSVHLYQADNSQSFSGQVIESQTQQFVVMGFVSDTNYVDQAFTELKSKCPNGRIEGINTRYSTSLGFFSWTNKIRMRGYCVTATKVARRTSSASDQNLNDFEHDNY